MTDVTRDERAELHAALGRIEALLIEIAGRQPAPRLTIAELAPAGTSARTAARRGHLAASAPGESLTEGARAPCASCYGWPGASLSAWARGAATEATTPVSSPRLGTRSGRTPHLNAAAARDRGTKAATRAKRGHTITGSQPAERLTRPTYRPFTPQQGQPP